MREIDKIVKDILTNYGFVFKKSSWYRVSDDFIQIINFQKSQFSNKFYINFGLDERDSQGLIYKNEYQFPIRLRADMMVLDEQLMAALDFEEPCSETIRNENLQALITNIVNFLDSINGWEQLKSAMHNKTHLIHKAFITGPFINKINNTFGSL